jgi:L-ascorbate metabolism protein UlaG (beta-lactamase superfamily)
MCNDRFYNYEGEKSPEFLLHSLAMLCQSSLKRFKNGTKVDVSRWHELYKPDDHSKDLRITWIGHATFLIQIAGLNIITDPIFSHASPLYRRIIPPGISLTDLPPIHFVLISHNHRDHMDAYSLYKLQSETHAYFLVPQGDGKWFNRKGFHNVSEHMWWDERAFASAFDDTSDIQFMFVPAYHWSQRGAFDYNKSLWGGWIIKARGKTIFFAGDTAYSHHFKNIKAEFPSIDVALMPIGPCEPRYAMTDSHLSSEEAGQAFIDLGARHFIPMHWGTFYFGTDNYTLPLDRLNRWWTHQGFPSDYVLHTPRAGQPLVFETSDVYKRKENPFIYRPKDLFL